MVLARGFRQLLDEAYARIETVSVPDALALHADPGVLFVDVRDIRELARDGVIPGSFHAPRGLLEFWVDPDSPYFRSVFGEGRRLVLYCASAWRSALACQTLVEMGVSSVCHLGGGLRAWRDAGGGAVVSISDG
ncbi:MULTISPECIES: rhodanese-like domain-containing protein [unclassified Haematospirillum]|uniref:rhodanese-like domain-containing protein n=1 Tax=unclassified Haematospirillum TaxID=2622088 RepID=UPI00143B286C|nr:MULTISPECIES: rhodanese-like domain-containing protein [unclassified Haematospirillum]NKD54946.1 rhodanese-like domain-containing protein [Haematospirillum sp. H4890]NKD74967.1 rhodanese-like domain-containing protein [Haematospirillum sp. H4485]